MALGDVLSGLGGLGEGYLKGTNQLQQLQSQQYLNALRALAMQQEIQGGGAAWQALQQNPGLMSQPGGQLPTMAPGQIQAEPLPPPSPSMASLPQVPDATSQMSGGGDLLMPNLAGKNVNWQGETPQFQTAVSNMLAAMPADLRAQASVDSGFRTREQQQDAYDRYLKGEIGLAAPPGQSRHEIGAAADWNTSSPAALSWMRQNAPRFGLDFPLGSKDPDHMQLLAANQMVQKLQQATPPPVKAAAQPAATEALRSFGGSPLGQIGRHDPSTIIQAIDKANPGAPDFIKFAAFQQLYPLLTNAGKIDFAQAIQLMNYKQRGEHYRAMEEKPPASAITGGPIVQPRDAEGKPVGNPGQVIGGRFTPIQGMPQGAEGGLSKVGVTPAGGRGGRPQSMQLTYPDGRVEEVFAQVQGPGRIVSVVTGNPIDLPQGTQITPLKAPGRQAATQINAQLGSANEVVRALDNMTDLPITSTSGWFKGVTQHTPEGMVEALKRSLGNNLTSEEAKSVIISFQGIQRAMATLEAQGRATGLVGLTQQAAVLMPQEGDTGLDVLRKYAEIRQLTEASLDTLSASPDIGLNQRAKIDEMDAKIKASVPWTVRDINALQRNPSDERVSDFAKRFGAVGAAGRASPDVTNMGDISTMDASNLQRLFTPDVWSTLTPQQQTQAADRVNELERQKNAGH